MLASHAGRAGLVSLTLGLVVLLWQPTDAGWWAARLFGAAALMLTACTLFLWPAPGRRPLHRIFGWAALAALVGHVTMTTAFQPVFWRWLSPAATDKAVQDVSAAAGQLRVTTATGAVLDVPYDAQFLRIGGIG